MQLDWTSTTVASWRLWVRIPPSGFSFLDIILTSLLIGAIAICADFAEFSHAAQFPPPRPPGYDRDMGERNNFYGWGVAAFFLVGLVILNVFPPDSTVMPWNDPILIGMGIALVVLPLVWAIERRQSKRSARRGSLRKYRRKS